MKLWMIVLPVAIGLAGCRLCESCVAPPAPIQTAAPLPPPVKVGTVAITPATASIEFTGSNLLMSQPGHFAAFEGELEVPSEKSSEARFRVVVDMDSTTTKIPRLTKHLKADDFFDVAKYPTAEFVSDRVTPAGDPDKVTVAGRLTLHGVTKPVEFPARFVVGPEEVVFEATLTVRQTEFGMTESARATRDEVPVKVTIRGRRR